MVLPRIYCVMKMIVSAAISLLLLAGCGQLETKWTHKFDVLGQGYYRINSISSTEGAVYLTGTFKGENQALKCFTARYDRDGSRKWYNILQAPGIEQAEGNCIVVLSTQEELIASRTDIYVVAQARDSQNHQSVILMKFDTLGTIEWQRTITTHDGPLTSVLMSDYGGNLYVAGWERDKANQPTMYVGKYDESGTTLWFTKYYNEQLLYDDLKFDIRQPGYLVAAGLIKNTGELFYMRCDADGQIQGPFKHANHEKTYRFCDVKVTPKGTLYLAGTITNTESGDDFLVSAYSEDNNLLWAEQYDGTAHKNDFARALAIDESLNVYVTGISENNQRVPAISTVKYDKEGNMGWVATLEQTAPAEPIIMIRSFMQLDKKPESRFFTIAGTSKNDAICLRLSSSGFYTSITRRSAAGRRTIPTALSGSYVALQTLHKERADALIVNYGPSTILGIARWD